MEIITNVESESIQCNKGEYSMDVTHCDHVEIVISVVIGVVFYDFAAIETVLQALRFQLSLCPWLHSKSF